MKNLIVIILTFSFFTVELQAQEKTDFGIKGGVSLSNITYYYFSDTSSRTGFFIGLYSEIRLSNTFSLQPEILYANHGNEAREILLGGSRDIDFKLDYIQIPLSLKLYLLNGFSAHVGPSFNFLLNQKVTYDNTEKSDVAKNFDFSAFAGLSFKVLGDFELTARYIQGFTHALDDGNSREKAKNKALQFGVGYRF